MSDKELKRELTVSYDLSPAMIEGKLRDKLIELGWKPPSTRPAADSELVEVLEYLQEPLEDVCCDMGADYEEGGTGKPTPEYHKLNRMIAAIQALSGGLTECEIEFLIDMIGSYRLTARKQGKSFRSGIIKKLQALKPTEKGD